MEPLMWSATFVCVEEHCHADSIENTKAKAVPAMKMIIAPMH